MNWKTLLVLLLFSFALGFWFSFQSPIQTGLSIVSPSEPDSIVPYFCPSNFCGQQLIQRINAAQKTIDVAIYSFTLDSVSDALIAAHQRGVSVRVLFDSGQASSEYSEDEKLAKAGILVKRMNLEKGIMHNKYLVIDSQLVGTGSFNYSQNASQFNRENLVFISNPETAQQFEKDFERLWNNS